MKLPNSKVYWADYLSYSALLTDQEICEVMKLIAMRAMSYENPQDNLRDNPQDNPQVSIQKQIQIQIEKLNQIQLDFYKCLEKSQDESAKDYLASITNGKKGGRPKKEKKSKDAEKDAQNEFVVDDCIKNALNYWLSYKKEKKQKYTKTGLQDCADKLKSLSGGNPEIAMQIVKQSTSNGWSGLFPLKNKVPQKESVWEHNMRVMREMEEENNANENLF